MPTYITTYYTALGSRTKFAAVSAATLRELTRILRAEIIGTNYFGLQTDGVGTVTAITDHDPQWATRWRPTARWLQMTNAKGDRIGTIAITRSDNKSFPPLRSKSK
jgi:hypothetical protein